MAYVVFTAAMIMGWSFLSIVGNERSRRVRDAQALADAEAKEQHHSLRPAHPRRLNRRQSPPPNPLPSQHRRLRASPPPRARAKGTDRLRPAQKCTLTPCAQRLTVNSVK